MMNAIGARRASIHPFTVRQASDNDRQQLLNLINHEIYVHRHLDWRAPLDWIGRSPYLVAEYKHTIQAALVCPPDPPEIAWIRLYAVSSAIDVGEAWKDLWSTALIELSGQSGSVVAAIPIQRWFSQLLERSRFTHTHNIILLLWDYNTGIPPETGKPTLIRSMIPDDLPKVQELDASSFSPLWRASLASLELAFRQGTVATVAEDGHILLGYQISTASPMGGHLARLAVRPDLQGQGIGYALVRDLLSQFQRRGAMRVTVNTQEENIASLTLYHKAGFRQTGETYPVFQYSCGTNLE